MTYSSVTSEQLEQLSKTISQTKALLGTWSDKLIDIRALQMDEAIEMNEETNKTIEMMEDYVLKYQQLLQNMTEQIEFAKNILVNSSTTTILPTLTDTISAATPVTTDIKSVE